MNDTQNEKVKRFINDKVMSDAVYELILASFLKKKSGDTSLLAASMLAVHNLSDAWKELELYRGDVDKENPTTSNVGM